MTMRRAAILCAALLLATPVTHVFAQDGPTKAQRDEAASRFRKGIELYNEGDNQAALAEFKRAYALAPNYAVLYNIGQVQFQMQDYPGALSAFERYLSEGGNRVPASRRAEVERDVAKLKSRVGFLDISASVDGAEIAIDDTTVGKSPLAKPVMVSAGRHRITASRDGRVAATRIVEIASGDTVDVKLELPENGSSAAPAPPPTPGPGPDPTGAGTKPPTGDTTTPEPTTPDDRPGIPWIGWGITGALAAGATVCGILALSASSDLEAERGRQQTDAETLPDAGTKTTGLALATDILAGGAIIAAGVSLYFTVKAVNASPSGEATGLVKETRVVAGPRGVSVIGKF
ncbi:MAG: PEGA domain-containing protein [Polyangiaceae bacterium]